jgi:hypothetical protein
MGIFGPATSSESFFACLLSLWLPLTPAPVAAIAMLLHRDQSRWSDPGGKTIANDRDD